MTNYRVVPDVLWERDPVHRGRKLSDISQKLLDGRVVEMHGERKTWGHLYKLAQKHGKRARTKTIEVNGEIVTLIRFEDASLV